MGSSERSWTLGAILLEEEAAVRVEAAGKLG